ncbi:hypothetical protein T45_09001 [Streptomyces turgidiscabies]|nr:hypothetical protein T45_09001 [Streptomyces turgidiscabies]
MHGRARRCNGAFVPGGPPYRHFLTGDLPPGAAGRRGRHCHRALRRCGLDGGRHGAGADESSREYDGRSDQTSHVGTTGSTGGVVTGWPGRSPARGASCVGARGRTSCFRPSNEVRVFGSPQLRTGRSAVPPSGLLPRRASSSWTVERSRGPSAGRVSSVILRGLQRARLQVLRAGKDGQRRREGVGGRPVADYPGALWCGPYPRRRGCTSVRRPHRRPWPRGSSCCRAVVTSPVWSLRVGRRLAVAEECVVAGRPSPRGDPTARGRRKRVRRPYGWRSLSPQFNPLHSIITMQCNALT